MEVRYLVGSKTSVDAFEEHRTYDEASEVARRWAAGGRTAVIYKAVPCAVFEAKVTVTEYRCEG